MNEHYPKLRMFEYGHRLKSCNDLPAQLPVDRGYGNHVARNVNNRDTFASGKLDIWEEARLGSPVNADPFLPWIHDMFPSRGGETIHFVAQNKRRCNSGKMHWADINDLVPQVTIMQPVSVERIDEETARKIAPNLWNSAESSNRSGVRYRLAPLEEADSGVSIILRSSWLFGLTTHRRAKTVCSLDSFADSEPWTTRNRHLHWSM